MSTTSTPSAPATPTNSFRSLRREFFPKTDDPKGFHVKPAGKRERRQSIVDALKQVIPAEESNERTVKQIQDALNTRTFKLGSVIVKVGTPQDCFFLVREGQVQVKEEKEAPVSPTAGSRTLAGTPITAATKGKGFFFGEHAFTRHYSTRPFQYTVVAASDVTVLYMSRPQYVLVKLVLAKRTAVTGDSIEKAEDKTKEEKEKKTWEGKITGVKKTAEDRKMIVEAFKHVIILKDLRDYQKEEVAERMWMERFKSKTTVIKQGEKGEIFYVVRKGEFEVVVDGAPVARKKNGVGFGELALMHNSIRTATVVAVEDSEVWAIYRWQVRKILADAWANIMKENYEFISKQVPQFEVLFEHERKKLAEVLTEKTYAAKETIIKQGEDADGFFIVKQGEVQVTVQDTDGVILPITTYKKGDYFGELALIENKKRAATVTALPGPAGEPVICLMVKARDFTTLLGPPLAALFAGRQTGYRKSIEHGREKVRASFTALSLKHTVSSDSSAATSAEKKESATQAIEVVISSPFSLASFSFSERQNIREAREAKEAKETKEAKEAKETTEAKGETSEVKVEKEDAKDTTKITVSAESETSTESAEKTTATEGKDGSSKKIKEPRASRLVNIKSFEDLTILGTLGRGAFGHVQLVKDKNGKCHALKTLNKHLLVETQQVSHSLREKRVLMLLDFPLLIQYRGFFQDANHIHFLMEPTLGGELSRVLQEREVLTEDEVRFFCANIVLAFDYMHQRGIVYRDLKPENLLLDKDGYLKFVDFGFAKKIEGERTYTLCGTPDYLAPEVVSGSGHNVSADWWTLGILIYEMLVGDPPFYAENQMGTYANIMKNEINFPDDLSPEASDIIKKFTHRNPPLRLGVTKGGVENIKTHPFFSNHDFDWKRVESRTMKAPIIPHIENEEDINNFEDYLGEDERWKDYTPDPSLPDPFASFDEP